MESRNADETLHVSGMSLNLCIISFAHVQRHLFAWCGPLIVFGFNDTSTLVVHFVSSPREREKRDSREDKRDEQGRKENK